jgi:hypothetical protein
MYDAKKTRDEVYFGNKTERQRRERELLWKSEDCSIMVQPLHDYNLCVCAISK